MIPNSYRIRNYDEIPTLTHSQVQELIQKGQQLVAYDQLVVSLKGFSHPGNSLVLQPYINNLSLNIKDQFKKNLHSDYAQLIISQRTIGKLSSPKNSPVSSQNPNLQGKILFSQVQQSPQFKLHQKTIQKIDFSKPIWTQIDQLNLEEKNALIHVPTFIQTEKKVVFKENAFEDLWYTTNFWRSSLTFQAGIISIFLYLLVQKEADLSLLYYLPFFAFGVLKWTLIEYCFHRFLLHYDLSKKPVIGDHLMHHVFPQIKGKIALSIHRAGYYTIGFYMFYSIFLEKFEIIVLLLGVLVGLTLYDITHYYFHFGPEVNIGWINYLKRNHLKHHYRNSDEGFGVSNTLWDNLFKTLHNEQIQK